MEVCFSTKQLSCRILRFTGRRTEILQYYGFRMTVDTLAFCAPQKNSCPPEFFSEKRKDDARVLERSSEPHPPPLFSRAGGRANKSTTIIPAATLLLLPLPLSDKATIINTSCSHNSSAAAAIAAVEQ
jgi:hypothetical protein